MDLIISIIWMIGIGLYTIIFGRSMADALAYKGPPDAGDKYVGFGLGFIAALFWPLCILPFHARRLILMLKTPKELEYEKREQAKKDQEELVKLRKLAKQHNLPMPE